MSTIRFLSIAEQVATHLRGELLQGHWSGEMPGKHQLAEELGVNNKTVESALRQLEAEGLLVGQGAGRRRGIVVPDGATKSRALRVAVLAGDTPGKSVAFKVDLLHQLMEAGHVAFFAPGSLVELGMDVARVARLVEQTEADAWVVGAGSHEVLEWFAAQPVPAFALFGRMTGLPLAGTGPDHVPALIAATRRLLGLGHRRIVLLEREGLRAGGPGRVERTMFELMESHGIATGPYNLPAWRDNAKDFRRCLDSLFRITAPTALIIDEAFLFAAAHQHLAQQGILAPAHVSLVCIDADPTFAWCHPSVAHIRWDSRPVVRRIVRWVASVACGKMDIRQSFTKAEFIEGGTIGPVPKNRR